MKKNTVLIFNQYYLPGYKAGGPIRSISNLAEWLGEDFNFKIITTDRDSFEKKSYDGIKVNDWNKIGKADVYYLKKEELNFRHLYKVIKETKYDVVYLNSFFNLWFSIIPILILKFLQRIDPSKILLAPRGELSDGALDQKTIKKKVFIRAARFLRIHNGIKWQATNEDEMKEIQKYFNIADSGIYIASNLPKRIKEEQLSVYNKKSEHLNIVFLSRITAKKNLDYALSLLRNVYEGTITFDIYGVIDNDGYWNKCLKIMDQLPVNISVNYLGVLSHEKVLSTLKKYDLFLLPTKGENFGHAIYEAMIAGTPVLISTKTPWKDLEKNEMGWSKNLDFPSKYLEIIKMLQNENTIKMSQRKSKVREQILRLDIQKTRNDSRKMFEDILK